MKILVFKTPEELGANAAKTGADYLRKVLKEKGHARLLLSTGASQFDTLESLVKENLDWSKVEMFHLDEYIGIPDTHPASFRKYLKERFISRVPLGKHHLISGEGDVEANIRVMSEEIMREPIDLGYIGIGENAHLAFNDPPADFDTEEPFIVVQLNETCKRQQAREGWFKTENDVPQTAISMSVKQILKCKKIIMSVPYSVKAKAVSDTLSLDVTNLVPATIVKQHPDVTIYLDNDSASSVRNFVN